MKLLAILAATSFLATAANAEVIADNLTPNDENNTVFEKNEAYVGNPVYDANGLMIGTVTAASVTDNGNHSLLIDFNENFPSEFRGMQFEIDDKWVTDGKLEFNDTADQIERKLKFSAAVNDAKS